MKIRVHQLTVATLLLLNSTFALSQDTIWQTTNETARLTGQTGLAVYFDANDQALRSKLSLAPNEVRGVTDTIELPMPDGTLATFSIVESSIMEDGLAAEFPNIKSYKVYGIDDPSASGRVDISPNGFRGMLMTAYGRVFINPADSRANRYVSSLRDGVYNHSDEPFQCDVYTLAENNKPELRNFSRNETVNRTPGSLKVYRLAVSATSEYVTTAGGGTLAGTIAEINTVINRVNQVYERDLGIRLILVANNSPLIEVAPADFGFTDNDPGALLAENQTRVDATIGDANYDIGHVFSTGGGGVASLGSVCGTGIKARGVTGVGAGATLLTGDGFYIDYVAHEIGHQFGANHTFNASTGGCSPANLNAGTAFEPGSGTTIMSYVGICGGEDINAPNNAGSADATFHAGSIVEIGAFLTTGGGNSCGTAFSVVPANSDPTSVATSDDQVIPASTPFLLFGTALDTGDEATLTYSWDQMDAGTVTTTAGNFNADAGTNPLFRSYIPQPTANRFFPSLRSQLDNVVANGEILPTQGRTLNFRLTVRDGKSGQGTGDVAVTVDATSGPFVITAPVAGPIVATTGTTVMWNVANTTNPPVSCANVDINLLTFSADSSTYAVTELVSGTLNDGSEAVVMTDNSSTKARFVVQCSGRIFYDISNADLVITGATPFPTTGNSTNISTAENYSTIALSSAAGAATTTAVAAGGGGGGGGAASAALLTFLLSLLMRAYWLRGRKVSVVKH